MLNTLLTSCFYLTLFKKFQIFKILNISCNITLLSKNVKNKKCAKYNNNTLLKSPWHGKVKYAEDLQYFHKLNLYARKTKNVQIIFTGLFAKISSQKMCHCHLHLLPFFKTLGFPKSYRMSKSNEPEVDLNIGLVG